MDTDLEASCRSTQELAEQSYGRTNPPSGHRLSEETAQSQGGDRPKQEPGARR
jgi:hypothetical protein